MLIDELKKRMFEAMKQKNVLEKEVLRTVIGDVTSTGAEPTDERVHAVVRKLVKSNEETLSVATDPDTQSNLEQELSLLRGFLPQTLDVGQIRQRLESVADAVRAAKNDGHAVGVAMKHLKAEGAPVDGKDVARAVQQMRSEEPTT